MYVLTMFFSRACPRTWNIDNHGESFFLLLYLFLPPLVLFLKFHVEKVIFKYLEEPIFSLRIQWGVKGYIQGEHIRIWRKWFWKSGYLHEHFLRNSSFLLHGARFLPSKIKKPDIGLPMDLCVLSTYLCVFCCHFFHLCCYPSVPNLY